VRSEAQIGEKRREERRPAEGSVRIQFANPRPVKVEGRLIDISSGGFRMAHSHTSLTTGQSVEFSHARSSGRARVMWNRILDQNVETGFLVIG
jgi:hypothetical protein